MPRAIDAKVGTRRYARHPVIEIIARLHQAIHLQASKLLSLREEVPLDDIQRRYGEIEELRDVLQSDLLQLMDEVAIGAAEIRPGTVLSHLEASVVAAEVH